MYVLNLKNGRPKQLCDFESWNFTVSSFFIEAKSEKEAYLEDLSFSLSQDHLFSKIYVIFWVFLLNSLYDVYVPVISKTLEHIETFNTNCKDST